MLGGWLLGALVACGPTERAPSASSPCHLRVEPGENDALALQSALLGAAPGSVICLEAGTYQMVDGLSIGVPGLTLRAADEPVILDFSAQPGRAPGLEITGDDVAIEGIELWDARSAAVRVMGADNVRLHSLRILWVHPSEEEADGIALFGASNTRIREVEALAASGFGIRVVGSPRTTIEGSSLHHNAVGIWVEGGADFELTGTELRTNRAGLVLATDAQGRGERARVHGNLIEGSRGDELASEGFAGLGVAVVGPYGAELRENFVRANDVAGLFVVSGDGKAAAKPLSVHENRFVGNGGGPTPERDIVLEVDEAASLCIRENEGSLHAAGAEIESGCPIR